MSEIPYTEFEERLVAGQVTVTEVIAYIEEHQQFRENQILRACADALADAVDVMVQRKVIDSRSLAADALLDYRDGKPTSRRSVAILRLAEALESFRTCTHCYCWCRHSAERHRGATHRFGCQGQVRCRLAARAHHEIMGYIGDPVRRKPQEEEWGGVLSAIVGPSEDLVYRVEVLLHPMLARDQAWMQRFLGKRAVVAVEAP